MGHEVHLLCQDREALALPWVDAAGDWDGGALELEVRRDPARATVYRPDIGELLPVYVADRYEGVEARPFQDLSEEELAAYVERNVAAVREVAARARPDVALANHLVMGPLILARALGGEVPYAVKIHGSALEYTVKPYPRFMPFAEEGIRGARGVLVGSRHTAESLWAAMAEPELEARTRLGPPGVDVGTFAPREPAAAAAGMAELAERLGAMAPEPATGLLVRPRPGRGGRRAARARSGARPDRGLRRQADRLQGRRAAARRLPARARARARRRGCSSSASAPSGRAWRSSRARSRAGTSPRPAPCAGRTGRSSRISRPSSTRSTPRRYAALARATAGKVHWAGRLEHEELTDVLPAMAAFAMPSTFPEAFGMVAAEAAACGVLPVVAGHSGMAEVAHSLAEAVDPEVAPWLTFQVGPGAVEELADGLASWLEAPDGATRAHARGDRRRRA